MRNITRTYAAVLLSFFIVGCDQSPPSYATNANEMIKNNIIQLTGSDATCTLTDDGYSWLSSCSVISAHPNPTFSIKEIEGVMQASDNLSFTIRPKNSDAEYFYSQKKFTSH